MKHRDDNPLGWVRKVKTKQRPRFALRFRIVFILLVVSLLPVLLLGVGSWVVFGRVLMDRSLQLQRVAVERHATAIELYLKERLRILKTIAKSYALEELTKENSLRNIFRVLDSTYPDAFVDIGVIDHRGFHLAYFGPYPLQDRNYRQSDWFNMVMSKGSYVSDVFLGYRKIPHLIIAIKRNDKKGSWILRATINSRRFYSLVQAGHMDKYTTVFIINKRGFLQTPSRLGDVLTSPSIASPRSDPGVSHDEIVVEGKTVIQSTTWINNGRWIMVVQQNRDQIMAALNRAVSWGIVVIIMAVGLVISTTVFATSHLVNRIKEALQQRDELHRDLLRSAKLASLGELATGMAHEINNPLAILRAEQTNIEDQIADSDLEGDVRKSLLKSTERCKRQIDRCGGITAKMLQFGRKSEASPERINIVPLIYDIISMLERQATIRNIALERLIEERLPDVYIDPSELEQVLINLVNNAFHAVDGEGVIRVSAESRGSEIEISVADDGRGIEKENLEKVFLPFFTTKPVGEGTGMGLSVCYGIVHGWGGTITVDSEVGIGTTFTIRLPVAAPDAATFINKSGANLRINEVV